MTISRRNTFLLALPAVINALGDGHPAIAQGIPNSNQVWAGPTSGPSNFPSWRALVLPDFPTGTPNTYLGGNTSGGPTYFNWTICTGPNSAVNYTGLVGPGCSTNFANLTTPGQTLSGGAIVSPANLGTLISGAATINCGNSPLQFAVNGGAFTLVAPVADSSCMVQLTNNGSAGSVTFSGFTVNTNFTGGTLSTTNTSKFMVSIGRINGSSIYTIIPQQ